jgi:hypothetical protein
MGKLNAELKQKILVIIQIKYFLKILTGKPTGKKRLGRPRHRLKDSIKVDFKEIVCNIRNWIDSDQYRNY